MATEKLALIVTGDSKSAVRALDDVGKKADKELGRATKSGDTWSRKTSDQTSKVGGSFSKFSGQATSGFNALAGAYALGGAAVVKFGLDSVKAYEESAKVGAQTEAVILSTGSAANVTADDVSKLANSISRKTGIDDEAIQSGENLLLTFTGIRNEVGEGNDVFNQATQVVTDLSAALGQDMKSSAIQVGKALNDPVKGLTALQRVGVQFTAQQKEQIKTLAESGKKLEAQKIILGELKREFGGSAEAIATPFDKLTVSVDNLQESIGSLIYPYLAGLATAVTEVTTKGTDFVTWAGEAGNKSGFLGDALGGVKDAALGAATGGVSYLAEDLYNLGSGTDHVKEKTDRLSESQRNLAELTASGSASEEDLAAARKEVADATADVKVITDAVTGATKGATDATNESAKADKDAADAKKKHEDAVRSFTDAIYGSRDAQRAQFDASLDLNDALGEYKTKADTATAAGGKNAAANRDAAEAYNEAADKIDQIGIAARATAEQQAKLQGRTLGAKDAAIVQRDALIGLRDQIAPGTPLRTYLDGLIGQLDNAARDRTGTLRINIAPGQFTVTGAGSFLSGKATGGPVTKGVPYIVGEKRPELFVPTENGMIVPSVPTTARGGSSFGRGGSTVSAASGPMTVQLVINGRVLASALAQTVSEGQASTLVRALAS